MDSFDNFSSGFTLGCGITLLAVLAFISPEDFKLGQSVRKMPVMSSLTNGGGDTNGWMYVECDPKTDYEVSKMGSGKTPEEVISSAKSVEGMN